MPEIGLLPELGPINCSYAASSLTDDVSSLYFTRAVGWLRRWEALFETESHQAHSPTASRRLNSACNQSCD
eukprot:9497292-Pyramimonas_sp.AAC.1